MKYINEELTTWAIDKIKKEYMDDIALLIGHKHWKIAIDGDDVAFNFFIPETDKGYELSQTFIIDEIGYDLFPMSWERVEGLSNINESLTTCLADGVILYAKNQEVKKRFEDLQKALKDNLSDPAIAYNKGLEKVNTVMDLYKNLTFETSQGAIRKASGYIVDFLSQAIATVNGTYLKRGPENIEKAIVALDDSPEGFIDLYKSIVQAKTTDEIKHLCYEIIQTTRTFLENKKPTTDETIEPKNIEELPEWYEEGTYTFRRIYYYCDQKDSYNAFAWGYNFQQEFDFLEAELGLDKMDLMAVYDADHLDVFKKKAKEIEAYIVQVIQDNQMKLRKYGSLEEFLNQQG